MGKRRPEKEKKDEIERRKEGKKELALGTNHKSEVLAGDHNCLNDRPILRKEVVQVFLRRRSCQISTKYLERLLHLPPVHSAKITKN